MSISSTDSAKKAFSNHLNRQLGLYSLAAAAAGVSMLALAQPAAGEVVVTKKTIPIPIVPIGSKEAVEISMANNGIENFAFQLSSAARGAGSLSERALDAWGESQPGGRGESRADAVACGGDFYAKALALPRGAQIGSNDNKCFSNYLVLIEATDSRNSSRYSRGYWGVKVKDHYLGVRFPIDGETHYGWIRLTVTIDLKPHGPSMSAIITAYAYETVAKKPIFAGTAEKSATELQVPENIENRRGPSLGMLALGADSLPLWRREEVAGAN
jgi:hypothetical protein